MTINFFEPGDVPQPKDKVKIEDIRAEVQPDRWRVKINLDVTPFQVRPNLGVVLLRQDTDASLVVADMTIIETMHKDMEFTMHIRHVEDPAGEYTLKARLYYEQGILEPYDEKQLGMMIPTHDEMPDTPLPYGYDDESS